MVNGVAPIRSTTSTPSSNPIPTSWLIGSLYGLQVLEITIFIVLVISYIKNKYDKKNVAEKVRRFIDYDRSILEFMKSVTRSDLVYIATYHEIKNVPKHELAMYSADKFVTIDRNQITDPKCKAHLQSKHIEIMINRCIVYQNKILAILTIQYHTRPSVPISELFDFQLLDTLYKRLL